MFVKSPVSENLTGFFFVHLVELNHFKMKNNVILLSVFIFFFSCSDDQDDKINNTIVSKWKLIETLADPGDGSGTFQPVSSNKIIEFYDDETFYSNGSICTISIDSNANFYGTYSVQNATLNSSQCQAQNFPTSYEMTQTTLIIYYPCIEACAEKYSKIE